MAKAKPKISQSFQRWLLVLVTVAFLVTTASLWVIQDRLSERNAVNLLEINVLDVREDIADASDENLLELTRLIATDLDEAALVDGALLMDLMSRYDVTEISCVGSDGLIYASTSLSFEGYDMASGSQSAQFLVLLEGAESFVQSYQPISYDSSISRKYAGVALERGGFVQVGYGAQRFQRDIDEFVVGVTRNRHVGESGCIIIADEDGVIVSDRFGNEGLGVEVSGVSLAEAASFGEGVFSANVYGEPSYCMHQFAEGYHVLASMPKAEAALSRNVSVAIITAMQVLVFVALFIMVFVLVRRQVVSNIYRVNDSLSAISKGELDTVVDVRSHVEFDDLSNDINATVDTLKRYIADAEARVDAELTLAKAIQHSALPSVFPPYPHRREFDIWASMRTAKEVGGDFYDFYFVDEDVLVFLVADVSGKGIPAAMFMMQSKTLLKSYAESGMSVDEVLTCANEKLCEGNDADMFVTVWLGCLNVSTGRLEFANAGHNPPVVRHADGSVELLKARPGLVLAGMEGIRYRRFEHGLAPGDALFLYTDGVTEATNVDDELYGEARLLSVLERSAGLDVWGVCEAVEADVDAFVGEAPQFDDITMLHLEYHAVIGKEAHVREITLSATVENVWTATEFVNELLEQVECPLKAQMQVDVAIDELFSNIAKYAYAPGSGEVTVRAGLLDDPRGVEVVFEDEGVAFDPLAAAAPDITLSAEDREVGGLGILMVKRTMDEVSYERREGRNVMTIRKRF
ncbi:MAG: SpoIIE family protein phosphatase [Eggerthellaceae bacterium]|nr:SpoIIE family protein phosphatase [Eggerthellaceae bacterium]